MAGILLGVLKPAVLERDVHLSHLPQSLAEEILRDLLSLAKTSA
jgi:hypothetical protein